MTMRFDGVHVVSPTLFPDEHWNEAETLGAITWLWLKAEQYKDAPVQTMAAWVLPVLKNGQFALFVKDGQPIGYIAWACLNEIAQENYIRNYFYIIDNNVWRSGEHKWITNWFAPLGHSRLIKKIIVNHLFPRECFRSLYHKGDVTGLRIMDFHGSAVNEEEFQLWKKENPIHY